MARARWSRPRTPPCTVRSGPGSTARHRPSTLRRPAMALLAAPIREQLELKRRHGADPDEVSRQEREALGAPVRGEFAKPAADPSESRDAEAPETEAADLGEVPEFDEPPEMPSAPEPDEPAAVAAGHDPEPEPGTEEDPWLVEDLADSEDEREPGPEAAAP